MTLLHRHSTARAAAPAPLPEMVFHGLAPDENAQMQGVVLGTGELVAARTSSIYTPDMDGVDREFIDVQPGISGARTDLNPVDYCYMVIATAETPDPFAVKIDYFSALPTARYKYIEPGGAMYFTSKVPDNVTTTGRPPDDTEVHWYSSRKDNIGSVYCNQQYAAGDANQWFSIDLGGQYLDNTRFTGTVNSPIAMSKGRLLGFIRTPGVTGAFPDFSTCPILETITFRATSMDSLAPDFAWPAGGGALTIFDAREGTFPSDVINQMLIAADAEIVDGTGVTLRMQGGSNGAPTGAGITAMNSLTTKGANVTTN